MNAEKSAISACPISTSSTSKVAKMGLSQPQHTTQHTTTKMSHCHLLSTGFALSLHGQNTGAPNQWHRGSLWSHARCLWLGLAARWLVRLFGVPNEDTSKNREICQALALDGRRSMMRDNNQLGDSGRVWRDVGEEAPGSCSVWGGGIQSFEVMNSAQKILII
jgi:hypothetical protein